MSRGKPIWLAAASASSSAIAPSLPGMTGMPMSCMAARARFLSPMSCMCWGSGPMKVRPRSWQAWAKRLFSERSP